MAVNWLVAFGDGILANSCFSLDIASITLSSGVTNGMVIWLCLNSTVSLILGDLVLLEKTLNER